MHPRSSLFLVLPFVAVLALSGVAVGQDEGWPQPADDWWERVKEGETATYSMTIGTQEMTMVITVEKVAGAQITFKTDTYLRADPPADARPDSSQSQTINGEEDTDLGQLPPGSKVTKGETTAMEVAGQAYEVTRYEVEVQGVTMTAWYCPALAPIFNGGNVKIVTGAGGAETTIALVKRGQLPPAEEPDGQ